MKADIPRLVANFNLSLVFTPLTFDDFTRFLSDNIAYLEKNGLEVIIGAGKNIDASKILKKILKYPFINWKLLSYETNNTPALVNRCIANAVKEDLLILSPFTRINSALLFRLKYLIINYRNAFITITRAQKNREPHQNDQPPGIIFLKRQDLLQVNGMEEYPSWIDSVTNLIRRLERSGINHLKHAGEILDDAKGIELDKGKSITSGKDLLYPDHKKASCSTLHGPAEDNLLYSWSECSYGEERCMKYIKNFVQAEVKKNCFARKYRVIALIQTYNEMRNMPDILRHLEQYCDGIILLDDSSTDGTYENAVSEKLVVKVQKKREEFNDLLNRNILFNLVSFFKTDWIFTLDADERFDARYDNLLGLLNSPFDVLEFPYVNLWNSTSTYRVNYSTSEGGDGIFYRKRMYRNMGRVQIFLNKKLHFNPVPHDENVGRVKILILHYGILSGDNRTNKFNFYTKQDSSKDHYEYNYKLLLDTDILLEKVENLDLEKIPSFKRIT